MRYNVQFLDVWGNEEEGWDVNAVYHTTHYLEIGKDDSGASILKQLFDMELLSEHGLKVAKVDNNSTEECIYIYNEVTHEPLFNVMLEEE